MSLRERGKQQRRTAMLEAAEELFAEVGFSRTTMDAIAARAGIGVATLYKYFGNKAGVMESLIRPDMELAFGEAGKIIANPPADAAKAMVALIDKYRLLRNDWSNRRLLRAMSILGNDSEDVLSALVNEADTRVQQQVRDLLLVLRARGDVRAGLNVEDASSILFCVFNQHYATFITHEEITAERMFSDLARRIDLVMQGWKTIVD